MDESRVRPLRGAQEQPRDYKETIENSVVSAEALLQETKYAEAFETFASALEMLERQGLIQEDLVQKDARRALKRVWKEFVSESTDHKKFSARLKSKSSETEERLTAAHAHRKKSEAMEEALSEQRKRYLRALSAQTNKVVAFPNAESKKAEFGRTFDDFVKRTIEDPLDAAYEPEFKHMAYEGISFWKVMPLVRTMAEGYVKSLLRGNKHMSDYAPVNSEMVRTTIVGFLRQAPQITELLAEAEMARDNAWDARRHFKK